VRTIPYTHTRQKNIVETIMKKQLFAGKFEIQGEISKGQTGTIYYGYDIGLRQEVAIKVYHSHINGRLIRGKSFIEKSKPLLLSGKELHRKIKTPSPSRSPESH
jgi:hypothetical protein